MKEGQNYGFFMDQEVVQIQTISPNPLAILNEYERVQPKVFKRHAAKLMSEMYGRNIDGSISVDEDTVRNRNIIWTWGGASGDGTSLGILAATKFVRERCQTLLGRTPNMVYHNLIDDIKISRRRGDIQSPQGFISGEEYERGRRISGEVRELILRYLPGYVSPHEPLLLIEDNCAETELYIDGKSYGSSRGNVRDLKRLVANRALVYKVSVNAPEYVNIEAMDLREAVPKIPNEEVNNYLLDRGIVDNREASLVKQSYIDCGNLLTLLQQYRDITINADVMIRKGFLQRTDLDLGEAQRVLSVAKPDLWRKLMSDPESRMVWDEFLIQYYYGWQKIFYGEDDPYRGIVLTPEQLPKTVLRVEDREWFAEQRALTKLVEVAQKTQEPYLINRLEELTIWPPDRLLTL
ncbi:MAG: hypothetical protein Q7S88_00050 [Candidatus Daviesbacteria bacterium]|nr:hypothetical protein [Candidatus Daviesbacteria bacterium]